MNEQILERVDAAISAVAEKLGQGADHFWPILVKQQVVEGAIGLTLICLFLLTFPPLFLTGIFRGWIDDDMTPRGAATVASGMTTVFGMIFVLATVTDAVTKITNPEYHALKLVLGAL